MGETFSLLLYGVAGVFTPTNMIAATVGTMLGIIVGATPGLGPVTGLAVLLPLTFAVPPDTALIMLAALYCSALNGGGIPAVLINVPGQASSVLTAIDGYAITKKGFPGKALSICYISSTISGFIAAAVLTIAGPILARVGLRMGPPELALLIIFAMTSIGWLLGDDIPGGLLSMGLGIMFATVGADVAAGHTRFHFRQPGLMGGIEMVPLVVGLYGFSHVIGMMVESFKKDSGDKTLQHVRIKDIFLSKEEWKLVLPASLRHSFLGTFIGVLPGAGATASAFISYIFEKRWSKRPEEFGKGSMEGLTAVESSNSAAATGSFAPLLSFGIPGSGATAVLLGGLMMWGVRPGPLLFTERPDIVWPLIASFYIVNVMAAVACYLLIPFSMRISTVRNSVLAPVIFAICFMAAYTTSLSMFDVFFMIFVGIFGYLLSLAKVSTAPLLLAYVLTPLLERYVRQALDMSRGDVSIFFRNAICWTLISLTVIFMISPFIAKRIKAMRAKRQV